ncbi:unnamed protein product [Rotaria sp. Silwood2]|nr:unnamed protein product [Rotaria sp. Silwood2]
MMLMHKSSSFRSLVLQHCYDYLDISNYTSISSNLTSLHSRIFTTLSTATLYLILSNFSCFVPNITLYCNENDHPILLQLISFNLIIFTLCDIYSIAYILRCMPNLSRFYFTLASRMTAFSYYRELFNGFVWQQLLKRYVPCLSKFEFHISILKTFSSLNLHYYQVI